MPEIQITLSGDETSLESIDHVELEMMLSEAVCTTLACTHDRIQPTELHVFSTEHGVLARVTVRTDQEDTREMQEKIQENVNAEVAEKEGYYGDLTVSVKALNA